MPFNQVHRRDSWPPTILHLHSTSPNAASDSAPDDIDPITFFLTPSTSLDDLDDEDYPFEIDDLLAGIEDSSPHSAKRPEVREISPSKIQRAKITDDPEVDLDSSNDENEDIHFDFSMPLLSLRDFSSKHTKSGRKSRLDNHRSEEALTGLGITLPRSPPSRGREKFRLTPGRGRGQTRSLSARRPHSWREPSPELGRIEEMDEDAESRMIEGKLIADVKILSSSAPPPISAMRVPGTPRKEKRVHWAM